MKTNDRLAETRRLRAIAALVALAGISVGHAAQPFLVRPGDIEKEPLVIDRVLEKVHEATGIDTLRNHRTGLQLVGKGEYVGNAVRVTSTFDAQGRFVRRMEGPVDYAIGFDGALAWQLEFAGFPRPLELGEKLDEQLSGAALTRSWLLGVPKLQLALADQQESNDHVMLVFQVEGGFQTGTIRIDRKTWLPTEFAFGGGGSGNRRFVYEGVREFDGMRWPARIREGIDESTDGDIEIETVGAAPVFVRSPYAVPPEPTERVRFSDRVPPNLVVERAPTGHLLVQPKINGKVLGWFIFDTGAGITCFSQKLADEMGIEQVGAVQALGVGGSVTSPLYRLASFELGPITFERDIAMGLDLAFLTKPLGRPIAGIVGYDVLARCVTEFSLSEGRVALHNPATYRREGTWANLHLPARVPAVDANVEGHAGIVRLDSGFSGKGLAIHYPAVQQFKMLEGRETKPSRDGGVGGSVRTAAGILKWIEFAGNRVESVETVFVLEAKGAFASPYTFGVMGGPLMRQFRIVIDYPGRKIAFRPIPAD